jgi:hypothetical protein
MDVVVEGKRYRTAAATLLASGPAWDERLGDDPRRLLEVRVGGLDLSAIVGGRGWERLGWQAFLFRTQKGNYFVQFQSTWPGERDRLLPLGLDEAMRLYGELPDKKTSFEEHSRAWRLRRPEAYSLREKHWLGRLRTTRRQTSSEFGLPTTIRE